MKRLSLMTVLLSCCVVAPSLWAQDAAPNKKLPSPDADGFIALFDGKSLDGWEGLPGFWSVKEGAIDGSETKDKSKQTFLILTASKENPAKFANFELRLAYKFLTAEGNSGVQFRSKIIDPATFRVGGYQADFDGKRQYDGGMYDEAGVAGKRGIMANTGDKTTWGADNKRVNEPLAQTKAELAKSIKEKDWNELILLVDGNHFKISVNGHVTADVFDNSPAALREGVIALQLHMGYTMSVQFKDVKIKLLGER